MKKKGRHRKGSIRRNIALFLAALLLIGVGFAGNKVLNKFDNQGNIASVTHQLIPSTKLHKSGPYVWKQGEPIGITLSGLQSYVLTGFLEETMCRQIRAAKKYWHANTIRLQLIQDKLVGADGHEFNKAYLAAIRGVSGCALIKHMTLVLNDQTEQSVGFGVDESLPTYATDMFWKRILSIPGYKNNPHVVLDLFNEPRRCDWDQWYTAMQPLVDYIRVNGITNTIWAEGIWWGSSLEGIPLLHDPLHKIVYEFHHPGAPLAGAVPFSKVTWNAAFGNLADSGVPVVDGEFANYKGSYDWPDGKVLVPEYLHYLTTHHIGMLGWGLLPGALNGKGGLSSMSYEPEGAGYIINRWFAMTARHNPHPKHHRRHK